MITRASLSSLAPPAGLFPRKLRKLRRNPRKFFSDALRNLRARNYGLSYNQFHSDGFCFVPRLLPEEEALSWARRLSAGRSKSMVDIARNLPATRTVIVDPRITDRISVLVDGQAKFLQSADFVENRNAEGWHRDSPCKRFGHGPDWQEPGYACVKALLYLDVEHVGLAVMAGSHTHQGKPKARLPLGAYQIVSRNAPALVPLMKSRTDEPRPVLLRPEPGDCVFFDTRLYHRGQSFSPDGSLAEGHPGRKATLNICYGPDNPHSYRFYSYYRYLRHEMGYADMPADFVRELKRRDLLLSIGEQNEFERNPSSAIGVFVKTPPGVEPKGFREITTPYDPQTCF